MCLCVYVNLDGKEILRKTDQGSYNQWNKETGFSSELSFVVAQAENCFSQRTRVPVFVLMFVVVVHLPYFTDCLNCKLSNGFPVLQGWAAMLQKLWELTSHHGHPRSQGIIMVLCIYICGRIYLSKTILKCWDDSESVWKLFMFCGCHGGWVDLTCHVWGCVAACAFVFLQVCVCALCVLVQLWNFGWCWLFNRQSKRCIRVKTWC